MRPMRFFAPTVLFCTLMGFSIPVQSQGGYSGSGSVTQGLGATAISNLFPGCAGSRVSAQGTIQSTDGKSWTVPAQTDFLTGPKLPDLYNSCNGFTPANIGAVNLNNLPVTVIDADGEEITGFIFSDNYCELYLNEVLVGVDPVPYTPFNACVVKFRIKRPYTIAVKLVDWEENLGLGTENNNGNPYHAGDGGFIAQFSDGTVTDSSWRVQTYYIAPLEDLSAVVELPDSTRSTATASNSPACGANCYGVHYAIPSNWESPAFNDAVWPKASLYTAAQVTNAPAYTNFAGVWNNARFIWSSNLFLDNLVLARKKVGAATATWEPSSTGSLRAVNPFEDRIEFSADEAMAHASAVLLDYTGKRVAGWSELVIETGEPVQLPLPAPLSEGLYILQVKTGDKVLSIRLLHL